MQTHVPLKSLWAAAGVALALGVAAPARAEVVTQWSVDVAAEFLCGTAVFTPGLAGTSCGATSIRFGDSLGAGQSGVDIFNAAGPVLVNTNGAAVASVAVSHLNRPIQGNLLDAVTLRTTLTLTPNVPALPGLPPDTLDFAIRLVNTGNGDDPCPDGTANGVGLNVNGCADIFIIDQQSLNFPFDYDTDGAGGDAPVQYFISFFEQGGGLGSLPAAACAAAGVAAPCLGFRTPEQLDTRFQFAALITTERVQVPLAPTPALLALGLAGMAWTRRRPSR